MPSSLGAVAALPSSSVRSSPGKPRLSRRQRFSSKRYWAWMQASGLALRRTTNSIGRERRKPRKSPDLSNGRVHFQLRNSSNVAQSLRTFRVGRALSKLLTFFRVGSIKAWQLRYGKENAAYRHSPSFKSDEVALATWLRLGEIQADEQECSEYNETEFKRALREIRHCTRAPIEESVSHVRQLCNRSGVALALIKPLPKTALSGAAKWLTPRKALIQLSARHNTDDHLWFSFYHEAAHILLHSKKNVFVDDMKQGNSKIEIEADDWAAKMLVPRSQWKRFVTSNFRSRRAVCAFAEELGIAPGIVVGMLQHQGLLPWSHLNGLKVRYRWKDD